MNTNIERRLSALEKKLDLQSESISETIKKTTIAHVEKHVNSRTKEIADGLSGNNYWIYAFLTAGCIFMILFCIIFKKLGRNSGSDGILGGFGGGKRWKD
jgi:hypothetical protein